MVHGSSATVRVEQPEAGDESRGYPRVSATRAGLLRPLARSEAAAAAYHKSLRPPPTEAERRSLTGRLIKVDADL